MGSLQSNFRWLWAAMKSYICHEELRFIAKVSETQQGDMADWKIRGVEVI